MKKVYIKMKRTVKIIGGWSRAIKMNRPTDDIVWIESPRALFCSSLVIVLFFLVGCNENEE